jgi:hypothetical protein
MGLRAQAEAVLGGKAKSLDQSLCTDTRLVKDALARWSLCLHHKISIKLASIIKWAFGRLVL